MDIIRSTLQPLTHNLPDPLRQLGVSLIGPVCYQTLVLDVDPAASPDCLRLAVSKALGVSIVAVSAVVKVPQLVKLASSRSPAGVSVLAYLLETAAYLISLAYNLRSRFPFSTYGETALIGVQNVAITVLVLGLAGRSVSAALFVAVLAVAASALLSEQVVDGKLLSMFQAGAGLLGVASKVPQIAAIWKEGGTGQLSAFAVFNYLVGSLTRIFTTLQEVDDKLILYGFVSGFVLNLVLAAQMIYYWNSPSAKVRGKQPERASIESDRAPGVGSSLAPIKASTTRRRG